MLIMAHNYDKFPFGKKDVKNERFVRVSHYISSELADSNLWR